MEKRTRAATESLVLILVIAGILVALNLLSTLGGYKRIDLTQTQRHTLSKGSGNLIQSFKHTMKISAYITKGTPKLDTFVRELRDLLQEYKTAGKGKLEYELIEAKDEDTKKKAKDAGLQEQPFIEASDTEQQAAVTQGFMGLLFEYADTKDVIPFLPPDRTEGLEFWITNKLREVRDMGENISHKIGIISGKEELKISETNLVPARAGKYSIQGIIQQNFKFYKIEEVDLKNGDAEIDDKLDGLIVTQAGKEFTDKELRRIDQFVMKGKSLAVFASAVNVKANDATMKGELKLQNLDKLLAGYGIEMRKDVVLDYGRPFMVMVPTQSGSVGRMGFPQFLMVEDDPRLEKDERLLDTGFPAFFRLQEVAIPFASSLVLHPEKQPGTDLKVIARSTPRSIRKTEDTVDLRRTPPPKGEWQQYNVAAVLEGKSLKSAFPPGGDNLGVQAPAESGRPARVFVLSSSQFLTNPLARAGNGPDMGHMGMQMPAIGGDEALLQLAMPYAQKAFTNTIVAFKNTLDWLSGDTDLLAASAKIISEPNLVYGDITKPTYDPNESEEQAKKRDDEMRQARKDQQKKVQWTLILGLPLLFALYGLIRWRMRVSSRANVSLA